MKNFLYNNFFLQKVTKPKPLDLFLLLRGISALMIFPKEEKYSLNPSFF